MTYGEVNWVLILLSFVICDYISNFWESSIVFPFSQQNLLKKFEKQKIFYKNI